MALSYIQRFLRHEAAGGMVMIATAAAALLLANSTMAAHYEAFIRLPLSDHFTLTQFVNDILMAIFFLLVGMELKREMVEGFLSGPGQKILPLIAALGGIVTPALIYLFINRDIAAHHQGWAIPTATDIAFAMCVLSLLGNRVPQAAKIFLLAIAIYDDLAAIIIIALFYSGGIALAPFYGALLVLAGLVCLNQYRVMQLPPYLLLAAALWYFLHEAGIHTTVAGMLAGVCIPVDKRGLGPLETLIEWLHPWVAFFILPLFAFVSAGVYLGGVSVQSLLDPLPLGIALGLFFGKQLGIFGATFAAVKCGVAARPKGASWPVIYGVSIIAGIGFTMSLFIGFLAFKSDAMHDAIKIGVLSGSLLSAIVGYTWLRLVTNGKN